MKTFTALVVINVCGGMCFLMRVLKVNKVRSVFQVFLVK
ncbi:hypothetical protein BV134_1124 [Haemophilus influenzae]|nr:hypothetical protein BV131_1123 [Haemophilus influenzae]AVJ05154.1 hypothetical protein BV134_1124 [Haemophilus influenzae]